MLEVIAKVLPILLLIGLGHVLKRIKLIQPGTIAELKKVVINVFLPALLFMAFTKVTMTKDYLMIFITVLAALSLMFGVGFAVKKLVRSENRALPAFYTSFETGMIGYSLYVAMYGQENMFKLAVVDLGGFVFMFFVVMSYLQSGAGQGFSLARVLKGIVTAPIVIAVAIGLLLSATGALNYMQTHALTQAPLTLIQMLGSVTVPVICLVIGYELHIELGSVARPLAMAVSRLALWLGLAWLVSTFVIDQWLGLDKGFQLAVYTMFLLPPSFGVPIFIPEAERESRQFILQGVSIHLILSIVAFIVISSTV
jgi:predicted permease